MADDSDLLDPSEIEALLKQSASSRPAPPPASAAAAASASSEASLPEVLSGNEIEQLFAAQRTTGHQSAPRASSATAARSGPSPAAPPPMSLNPEALLQKAEAGLAAALDNGGRSRRTHSGPLPDASPYELAALSGSIDAGTAMAISAINEVEFDLRIELGRAELLVEEVLKLREGSVVPLDKLAGDPVDILVNGRLVARGEVLVLNDSFCVRIAEILAPPPP